MFNSNLMNFLVFMAAIALFAFAFSELTAAGDIVIEAHQSTRDTIEYLINNR